MDSQQVEIIGRNWLVSELYRSGLEVARPERDHGIDLIAYLDLDQSGYFIGRPLQLKAARRQSFGVWEKHRRFHDLLLACVWNREGLNEAVCYCLTLKPKKLQSRWAGPRPGRGWSRAVTSAHRRAAN